MPDRRSPWTRDAVRAGNVARELARQCDLLLAQAPNGGPDALRALVIGGDLAVLARIVKRMERRYYRERNARGRAILVDTEQSR